MLTLSIVLPVFLVIWLGFFLRLTGLAPQAFVNGANRLIYYSALPILLFHKIAEADFSASFNAAAISGLLAALFLSTLFSYCWGIFRSYPPALLGSFTQAAVRGNLAYVALAVSASAYGTEGVAKAGIMLGCIVPLINIIAVVVLLLARNNDGSKKQSGAVAFCKEIVYNPLCISAGIGICWCYWQLPLPQCIADGFNLFGSLALPLALICIGASFLPEKKRDSAEKRKESKARFIEHLEPMLLALVIKLLLQPLLAGVIVYLFGVRGIDLGIVILFAGAPTATAAYILADQLDGDTEFTAQAILLTTFFTLFSYTAILFLLHDKIL